MAGTALSRSVWWEGGADSTGALMMLDQRDIPHSVRIESHTTVTAVAVSIKIMLVRGAPAIGAAGGFGMAIAAISSTATTSQQLIAELAAAKLELDAARPTAVNLTWATSRIQNLAELLHTRSDAAAAVFDRTRYAQILLQEAQALADDDVRINKALAAHGAVMVKQNANILHHCNTGKLATVDWGTALGVIYTAHEQQKNVHVWVDETRPRLQGAKLTCYELMQAGVPLHLIPDSASGILM